YQDEKLSPLQVVLKKGANTVNFTLADLPAPAPTGTVNGKVLLEGKALSSGTVAFIDADGKPAAAVEVQKDGTYKAEGLRVGKYLVTVSPKVGDLMAMIPARYTNPMTSLLSV